MEKNRTYWCNNSGLLKRGTVWGNFFGLKNAKNSKNIAFVLFLDVVPRKFVENRKYWTGKLKIDHSKNTKTLILVSFLTLRSKCCVKVEERFKKGRKKKENSIFRDEKGSYLDWLEISKHFKMNQRNWDSQKLIK